jgi:hypothetical protein
MKSKLTLILAPFAVMLLAAQLLADQIVLKDGRQFSGKFVRADVNIVEFRIFGKVETFKTSDVAQIVFKEPELVSPPVRQETVQATPVPTAPPAPVPAEKAPPVATHPTGTPATVTAAPGQPVPSVTLPEGTPITIRTTTTIDTDRNRVGDPFDATLEEPLALGSQVLAPGGTPVKGRIAYAKESGKLSGQSMLILELTEITVAGRTYPLSTSDYSQVGSSRGKQTAGAVGGGAAVGAIIGAIAGGGKGAAIGAATGAAVGTGVQVVTSGQTLKVPAETVLEFKLQRPVTIEAR